jgi:hypothetical protein
MIFNGTGVGLAWCIQSNCKKISELEHDSIKIRDVKVFLNISNLHCKKRYSIFLSKAGISSLTKLFPAKGEFG